MISRGRMRGSGKKRIGQREGQQRALHRRVLSNVLQWLLWPFREVNVQLKQNWQRARHLSPATENLIGQAETRLFESSTHQKITQKHIVYRQWEQPQTSCGSLSKDPSSCLCVQGNLTELYQQFPFALHLGLKPAFPMYKGDNSK